MTDQPLFSVIVPTYDRPACLPEALESVRRQTIEDFECLIVDDGGPDNVELPDNPRFRLKMPARLELADEGLARQSTAIRWVRHVHRPPDACPLSEGDVRGTVHEAVKAVAHLGSSIRHTTQKVAHASDTMGAA